MLDKQVSKAYRRVITAPSEYQAFLLIERMSPSLAKLVLMKIVMRQKRAE